MRSLCLSIAAAAAVLLPSYLRVGAFVLPVSFSAGGISQKNIGSSSSSRRWATSAPSATTATADVEEAKSNLKRVLAENNGSTLSEEFIAALEALTKLNPTTDPARAWSLLTGDWLSIGEDFKGTKRTPDGVECTLGRLSFNIFEPVKMPVLITSIENILGERPEKASSTDESLYRTTTHFVARDESGLKGVITIDGVVAEDPSDPKRWLIKFSNGFIKPDDGQDLDSWSKVIGVKDLTDKDSKGPLSWVKGKALGLMLKLAFGFRGPADELGSRGELYYEMKRSPSAWLDVLFIDDDMRITLGSKGAITVVVRC